MCSGEFCEIFKSKFFNRTPLVAAFGRIFSTIKENERLALRDRLQILLLILSEFKRIN